MITGLGTILGVVNMVTTIVYLRAPDMTMFRMPIFPSWVRVQSECQSWTQAHRGECIGFQWRTDAGFTVSVAGQGVAPVVAVQHGGQQLSTQTTPVAAGPVDVQPQ